MITNPHDGGRAMEGADQAERTVQELNDGIYFPLPTALEKALVPEGDQEIRIEVSSGDWIDTKTSHSWRAKADD